MGMLTSQQWAELEFWAGLLQRVGPEYYYAYRGAEYFDKTKHFPGFIDQQGSGLDLGCGCVSVFELSRKKVVAVDALHDNYAELLVRNNIVTCLSYRQMDNEEIPYPDSNFDWVACLNMIDHTPHPRKVLEEIARVLRPGGKLFFEVNFEAGIAPPHYQVWDINTVTRMFEGLPFEFGYQQIENVPEHNQKRCWRELRRL